MNVPRVVTSPSHSALLKSVPIIHVLASFSSFLRVGCLFCSLSLLGFNEILDESGVCPKVIRLASQDEKRFVRSGWCRFAEQVIGLSIKYYDGQSIKLDDLANGTVKSQIVQKKYQRKPSSFGRNWTIGPGNRSQSTKACRLT